MPKSTRGKDFEGDIREDLARIDELTPEEIYQLSQEILDDPELKQHVSSGNLGFLKQGVAYRQKHGEEKFAQTKYPTSMRNHLRALPHQEGFIASKTGDLSMESGVVGYARILDELRKIRRLSLNGLIELGEEITSDPILSSVPGQATNLTTIRNMVDKYNEIVGQKGVEAAEMYLRSASGSGNVRMNSMINILTKSYLPNLPGHIAKKSKEKRG